MEQVVCTVLFVLFTETQQLPPRNSPLILYCSVCDINCPSSNSSTTKELFTCMIMEKLMLYSSFLNEQYTYMMYQQYTLLFTTFSNTGQMGLNGNINIEQTDSYS